MRIHRAISAMNKSLQLPAFAAPINTNALPASLAILNGMCRSIGSLHFVKVGVWPAGNRFAHAYRILSVLRFEVGSEDLARSARALNVRARAESPFFCSHIAI